MRDAHLYNDLWKKYLPVIRIFLKKSTEESQTLKLFKHEFEVVGDREKAGYQFNLELNKGVVANNISGSAVARDLRDVLHEDQSARNLLKEGHYKINLDTAFVLHITKIP